MAKWLKANDPYQHLVTTSFSGSLTYPAMWSLPALDYIQRHMYLAGLDTKTPPAQNIDATVQKFRDNFSKPIYIGEYGVTWKGFAKEWDPQFRGTKQGLWAGIMCGSAGTVVPWWWEHIHEERLYPMWKSVSSFIQNTGFGSADWRPMPLPVAASDSITAYAMTDGKTTLLWLLDKRYEYPNNATLEAEPLAGATLNLPLPDGSYDIAWYDTTAGQDISTQTAQAQNNALTLQVPQFKADIAAKIIAQNP
jgi:hypothetical protein